MCLPDLVLKVRFIVIRASRARHQSEIHEGWLVLCVRAVLFLKSQEASVSSVGLDFLRDLGWLGDTGPQDTTLILGGDWFLLLARAWGTYDGHHRPFFPWFVV